MAEHRFLKATAVYYDAVREDQANIGLLRPTVDAFFRDCFENCDSSTILALVDAWLATFYDDIPVLLNLAGYQEEQGQPEAAANTLFLARTYALQASEQWAVNQALRQLTRRTDDRLSADERWIELVGYYEYLAAIDFTTMNFELRRALLYRRLGEQSRGDELLATLFAGDDGRNREWTAMLERHLAETAPETAPGMELSSAIPLERHGDSYLVEVTLNDKARLQLLVDTGASMTAITRESFRRQHRPDFSLRGTRLFNTATGYTRGDVYRASTITLGQERLEGIDIAVLDFPTMGDIDGLLGMNVLRQFGFEIDQTSAVMHLDRR